jgi:hypothetical protein
LLECAPPRPASPRCNADASSACAQGSYHACGPCSAAREPRRVDAKKDLDGARRDAHLDLGANERVWNRIEEVVDLDVIVEVDPRAPPFRELPVLRRQRSQGVTFDLLEQLASAEAKTAHRALVHPLHNQRNGLIAFGEREEGLRAQSPQDVGLRKSGAGLDP